MIGGSQYWIFRTAMSKRATRLGRPQVTHAAVRKLRAARRALWRGAWLAPSLAPHFWALRPSVKQIIGCLRWSAMMVAWNVVALVSFIVLLSLLGTDQG